MSDKSNSNTLINYSLLRWSTVFKPFADLMQKCSLSALLSFTFFYGSILLLNLACNVATETEVILVKKDRYEFLQNYEDRTDAYMRRHLVDYFQLIALKSEYGQNLPILKKWTKPMSIYVSGDLDSLLMTELATIIEELNPLFTDGFNIEIVNDSLVSNFHIYLGDKVTYGKMYPKTTSLLKENDGLFTYYLNEDFSIKSGHLFVELHELPIRFQKHILREELTQSLGLPNDIDSYPHSIFYKNWSDVQCYSELDIEVIRLLYHPELIPNLGVNSVRSILENILGI